MKVKKYELVTKVILTTLIQLMLLMLYCFYCMEIENSRNNCPFLFNRLIKLENFYWTFRVIKWSMAYISLRNLFNIIVKNSTDTVEEKYKEKEIVVLVSNIDLLDYSNPFLYGKKTEDMLN